MFDVVIWQFYVKGYCVCGYFVWFVVDQVGGWIVFGEFQFEQCEVVIGGNGVCLCYVFVEVDVDDGECGN